MIVAALKNMFHQDDLVKRYLSSLRTTVVRYLRANINEISESEGYEELEREFKDELYEYLMSGMKRKRPATADNNDVEITLVHGSRLVRIQ